MASTRRAVTQSSGGDGARFVDTDDDEPHQCSPEEEEQRHISLSQTDNVTPTATREKRRRSLVDDGASEAPLRSAKSIHDRLHGAVRLPGLLVHVMDTAEFQRLDGIKQLGGSVCVYPSATHSRKEHSIGVSHMAGQMVRHLRTAQPELGAAPARNLRGRARLPVIPTFDRHRRRRRDVRHARRALPRRRPRPVLRPRPDETSFAKDSGGAQVLAHVGGLRAAHHGRRHVLPRDHVRRDRAAHRRQVRDPARPVPLPEFCL